MGEPTVWQYRLRTEQGAWLADVILRSDGFFATVSDWGNYAFRWTCPGRPFREFVAGLEKSPGYVCSKLERSDWWDGERTLKAIREHITTYRRDGSYSKAEAKEAWESVVKALGCWRRRDARSIHEIDIGQFAVWCAETKVDTPYEFARNDYPPDVRSFAREVMPVLAKAIRAELQAESTASAGAEVAHG